MDVCQRNLHYCNDAGVHLFAGANAADITVVFKNHPATPTGRLEVIPSQNPVGRKQSHRRMAEDRPLIIASRLPHCSSVAEHLQYLYNRHRRNSDKSTSARTFCPSAGACGGRGDLEICQGE